MVPGGKYHAKFRENRSVQKLEEEAQVHAHEHGERKGLIFKRKECRLKILPGG